MIMHNRWMRIGQEKIVEKKYKKVNKNYQLLAKKKEKQKLIIMNKCGDYFKFNYRKQIRN